MGLDVVSVSQPEPVLLERNVMAVTDDVDQARAAVVASKISRSTTRGSASSCSNRLMRGHRVARSRSHGPGRSDAARCRPRGHRRSRGRCHRRCARGPDRRGDGWRQHGLTGAVVGAFTGAVLGAIICVFAGLGGSTAYTDTFIDAKDSHVCLGVVAHQRSRRGEGRPHAAFRPSRGPTFRCRRERQDEAALTWHAHLDRLDQLRAGQRPGEGVHARCATTTSTSTSSTRSRAPASATARCRRSRARRSTPTTSRWASRSARASYVTFDKDELEELRPASTKAIEIDRLRRPRRDRPDLLRAHLLAGARRRRGEEGVRAAARGDGGARPGRHRHAS